MEFQVDLLDSEASNDFMSSPAFDANPIGETFDPDRFVELVEAGEPLDEVIFRSDQQPVGSAGRLV